jgi:hypothetical protein
VPVSYTISTPDWPLACVTYKGLLREDEVEPLLKEFSSFLERREMFIIIHDSREADPSPRKIRYQISDWIRANESQLRDYCLGTVIVSESLAIRLVLQFILMISPLPNETYVCRTPEEASRWSKECFKRHGLSADGVPFLQRA